MTEQKKDAPKTAPKKAAKPVTPKPYILPSQRILNAVAESNHNGHPMSPFDISLMIETSILDKLEEVCLLLKVGLKQQSNSISTPSAPTVGTSSPQ